MASSTRFLRGTLAQRIASALVLAGLVIAALFGLPTPGFAAFLHVLLLLAAYEWAKLAGVETRAGWLGYAALLSALAVALWLLPSGRELALALAAAFWVAASVLVVCFPASAAVARRPALQLPAGMLALLGAWLALVVLRDSHGPWFVVWLLAAVTLADTGAYFAGRRFGRRKLAPKVSPNKTWEGLAGGAVAVLAWALGGALVLPGTALGWLAGAAVVALAAVVGDLFESILKRLRGVKDSGKIIPGHGGLLDRIDGVLAAAPLFTLYASAALPGT